jgi:hypothetical protein
MFKIDWHCELFIPEIACFNARSLANYPMLSVDPTFTERNNEGLRVSFNDIAAAYFLGFEIEYFIYSRKITSCEIVFFFNELFTLEFKTMCNDPKDHEAAIFEANKVMNTNFNTVNVLHLLGSFVDISATQVTHEQLFNLGRIYARILIEKYSYSMPQEIMDFYKDTI